MKTNRAARIMLKVRFIAICVAVLGMAGVGAKMGKSSNVRWGQAATLQIQYPQPPSLSIGDLMVAVR
ncbi:MAG TPA: hypothetical protein VI136_22375 [Verrucomicrobiae bacterium]